MIKQANLTLILYAVIFLLLDSYKLQCPHVTSERHHGQVQVTLLVLKNKFCLHIEKKQ